MFKQPYNWARIERGDIISFRYTGSDGRSTKRTVIILERKLKHPKSRNVLMHGIQLDDRNIPAIKSEPVLIQLFEEVGEPVEVDKDNNIIRLLVKDQNPAIYNRTKDIIKRYGLYRTYLWEKASRASVFREPVKIDPAILDAITIKTKQRSAR
mgnify:CR=1 FL=1